MNMHHDNEHEVGQIETSYRKTALSSLMMPAVAACFLVAVVIAACISSKWPLVHDAPLIHYVVFLMDHGRAPYRDIVEMNMPGTYILDWAAIRIFGGGAGGWWLWDISSGLVVILASAWIAGLGKRAAGLAGGALAYLSHLSEGPWHLGQRDWIVAAIVLLAVGCLFAEIREDRPAWMAGFFGLSMIAASIKPPIFVIAVFFLIATCWYARRVGRRASPIVLWCAAGAIIPTIVIMGFLLQWRVAKEFFVILHGLVPWYAGLQRLSYTELLTLAIPRLFRPLCLGAFLLFLAGRSWRRWESNFLLAGILAGAGLFISQGKGWSYHLGVELAFLSLWIMLEIDRGLRASPRQRNVAVLTLLVAVLLVLPWQLRKERRSGYPMTTISHLEHDLNSLGGSQLSGDVQCLDMTMAGCINVLYRMELVQSTGFIYDFYLFPKQTNHITQPLQSRFLREMNARPPKVIVLSSHIWPGDMYGYEELANWPAFNEWLDQRYEIAKEEPKNSAAGYRLYMLKERTR